MKSGRAATIAKWAVLIGVVPVVLAVLVPRADNPPGNVKPASQRQTMPDFALRDLGGGDWKLSAHRGDVVLVNFWATWCSPCREETPGLVRLAHRYAAKGLKVAGISMDENGAAGVRKFTREWGIDYPVMMPDSSFLLANQIENLPTTFLIDRQGRIAKTYVGGVREAVFRADIERLLSEPVS